MKGLLSDTLTSLIDSEIKFSTPTIFSSLLAIRFFKARGLSQLHALKQKSMNRFRGVQIVNLDSLNSIDEKGVPFNSRIDR